MVTALRPKLTLRIEDERLYWKLNRLARQMDRSLNYTAQECIKSGLSELTEGEPHVIALSKLEAKAGQIRITKVPEGQ